jgi:hypothetical protein
MIAGMSPMRGLPSRIRMRSRKSCFSGSLSLLNAVAIGVMSFDVDSASAALASSVSVATSPEAMGWSGRRRARNESVDTVPVVNRKNRRFGAVRPSRSYRASQMLTDFQKSVDSPVSLSPTALCLSEARDLPPSPSMKSRSSSFSKKTAVFSGNCNRWSRARRAW